MKKKEYSNKIMVLKVREISGQVLTPQNKGKRMFALRSRASTDETLSKERSKNMSQELTTQLTGNLSFLDRHKLEKLFLLVPFLSYI